MNKISFLVAEVSLLMSFTCVAYGARPQAPVSSTAPCAVIMDFSGEVGIMDPSRTILIDTLPKAGVPCSGWVSVLNGWVELRHRDGHVIHLGPETFAQFPDSTAVAREAVVLYKGDLFGESGQGSGELGVLTTNARVRIKKGSGIVVYSQSDDETQLIAISNSSIIENRFEPSAKMSVRPGEASSLNYRALRVMPSAPRAIALAALKPKLVGLQVDEKTKTYALWAAKKRADRKFAAVFAQPNEGAKKTGNNTERTPAQVLEKKSSSVSYARHPPKPEDAKLRDYLSKKTVAEQSIGEKILFPDVYYGRPQSVRVDVIDPLATYDRKNRKEENEEKVRLIEELSQIRLSD